MIKLNFVIYNIIIIQATGIVKHGQLQNCEENTQYLINLLALACEYLSSIDGTIIRGACINCFSTALRANNNQPSLDEVATCSELYFDDSRFADCRNVITASQSYLNGGCIFGYCPFVQCIRRVHSNILISRCYSEASINNDANLEDDQITLYKNITSCILARARCLSINPITGQRQSNIRTTMSYNQFYKPITTTVPIYNSLQINRAGDLRLVAFSGTTTIKRYVCPYEFNLAELGWNNLNC